MSRVGIGVAAPFKGVALPVLLLGLEVVNGVYDEVEGYAALAAVFVGDETGGVVLAGMVVRHDKAMAGVGARLGEAQGVVKLLVFVVPRVDIEVVGG